MQKSQIFILISITFFFNCGYIQSKKNDSSNLLALLGGAAVSSSGTSSSGTSSAETYSISGTISGLTTAGLVLQNNSKDNLTIQSGSTNFSFATAIKSGSTYSVSVQSQPAGIFCSIDNGNGTANSNISNVNIVCIPNKDITSFSLAGNAGTIGANTITVTLPFGTNATNLVATFIHHGASTNISGVNQVSGVTANNFTTSKTYTVVDSDNSTKNYTVTATVSLNPAKDILAYTINGQLGAINGNAINVNVPNGTNVTNLIAHFATTGASINITGANQTSGTTTNNFTSSKAYTVVAADGSTKNYTITVTVNPSTDPDGDGYLGVNDRCPLTADPMQGDVDGDGIGDACDNCPATPNTNQLDNDGDGRGNVCENCPNIANAGQEDADSDTVGDACDNCVNVSNWTQVDNDGDGKGAACDANDNNPLVLNRTKFDSKFIFSFGIFRSEFYKSNKYLRESRKDQSSLVCSINSNQMFFKNKSN
jgi:hypothetical protein